MPLQGSRLPDNRVHRGSGGYTTLKTHRASQIASDAGHCGWFSVVRCLSLYTRLPECSRSHRHRFLLLLPWIQHASPGFTVILVDLVVRDVLAAPPEFVKEETPPYRIPSQAFSIAAV